MKKIVIIASLVASVVASAASVNANKYVDPRAPFNGERVFNALTLPSDQ